MSQKLVFHWHDFAGGLRPGCRQDPVENDSLKLLVCFMGDDGGLSRETTIDVLREGLALVNSVMNGLVETADFAREALSATLYRDRAEIEWNWPSDERAVVAIEPFRRVLAEWLDFIESPAAIGSVRTVEL